MSTRYRRVWICQVKHVLSMCQRWPSLGGGLKRTEPKGETLRVGSVASRSPWVSAQGHADVPGAGEPIVRTESNVQIDLEIQAETELSTVSKLGSPGIVWEKGAAS